MQTFNPKIRGRRYNQFVIAPTYVAKSLFPRYIFAQFKINDLYHKVRFTRGIYSAVNFRGSPTPIDKEIIMLIRSNMTDRVRVLLETVSYQSHVEIERDLVKKPNQGFRSTTSS